MNLGQLNKKSIDTFTFGKFKLDKSKNEIRFYYLLGDKTGFAETLRLDLKKVDWNKVNREALNRILFNLHLIIGISYWKTYCPKKIIIKSGKLSKGQAEYWNKIYTIGLGEFYYKNKIDFRGRVKFPYEKVQARPVKLDLKNRALVPIGGGKDSIVTAELLKKNGFNFKLISLGDSKIQKDVSKIAGKERIVIGRELDRNLFKLKNAYNGHIPVSLIYSFASLLACVLYNYKYLVFSNEQSANFGNVKYLGFNINHQYSKSFEAEKDFSNYIYKYISPSLSSFSLLRPFSELKITQIFSGHKKYFSYFSSCNKNFKLSGKSQKRWCGECPKCAFTFNQLAAFIPKKTLIDIFCQDLYNKKSLLNLYQELLGVKAVKPFDCVGTPEEVAAAMLLALDNKDFSNDYILKYFQYKALLRKKNKKLLIKKSLSRRDKRQIPKIFQRIIKGN